MYKVASSIREAWVGLGELKVANHQGAVIICVGIGSCVAVSIYDVVARVGGMVHIVLPISPPMSTGQNNQVERLGKYANEGIPALIDAILKLGADRNHLQAKISGGAQMSGPQGRLNVFKIGERNVEEVKFSLERERIYLAAAQVGGSSGRSVRMHLDTGALTIRSLGKEVITI